MFRTSDLEWQEKKLTQELCKGQACSSMVEEYSCMYEILDSISGTEKNKNKKNYSLEQKVGKQTSRGKVF